MPDEAGPDDAPDREGDPLNGPLREFLRPRNTADQIAERLVTALALGEYVPGQRLPTERALADTLGVSRGRVRSALHKLADGGYLEIRRGRHGGAFVRSDWGAWSTAMIRRTLVPHWDQMEQLLDLVALIESLIARTTAERRTEKDVETIYAAALAYREAPDRAASYVADDAFHTALAAATRNSYLADLASKLRQEVTLGFRAHPYSDATRQTAIGQHEALAKAVAEQRADDAATLMAQHMRLTEAAMRALVERVTNDGES
jgi:DNA-binding FadR family transcriptional regulator